MSDIKKLKFAELKKELSDRGLSTKGKKDELLQRLQEVLDADSGGDADDLNAGSEKEVEESAAGEEEEEEEDEVEDGGDEILEGDLEEEDEVVKDLIMEDKTGGEAEEEEEILKPELEERNQVTAVTAKRIKITAPVTDDQRKKLREEKFQTPLPDVDKKAARAKRFGEIASNNSTEKSSGRTTVGPDAADRLKKRAERFGTNVAPAALKVEEKEKMLKRKQRFGGIVGTTGSKDLEAKKKLRSERFNVA